MTNKLSPTPEPGGVSQSVDYEGEVRKVYPKAFHYRTTRKYYVVMANPMGERLSEGKQVALAWKNAYDELPSVPSPEPKVEPAAELDYERLFKRDHPSAILTAVAFEGWCIYVDGVNGAYSFNKRFFDRHEDAWRDAYSKLAKEEPSNLLFCPGCEDDFDPQYDKHVVGDQVYCCDLCYQRNGKPKPVVNPSPVKVGEPDDAVSRKRIIEFCEGLKDGVLEKKRKTNADYDVIGVLQVIAEFTQTLLPLAAWNAAMAAKSGTAMEHKIYWSESTVGCSCGWKFEFGDKGVDYGQEKYDAHAKSGTGDGVGTTDGEHVWIAAYKASEDAGVLSRGVIFRSIHDSKEEAEQMRHPHSLNFIVTEYAPVAKPDLLPLTPEGK